MSKKKRIPRRIPSYWADTTHFNPTTEPASTRISLSTDNKTEGQVSPSAAEDLESLLTTLISIDRDLGSNPLLFGERNFKARERARAMIQEIETRLDKKK